MDAPDTRGGVAPFTKVGDHECGCVSRFSVDEEEGGVCVVRVPCRGRRRRKRNNGICWGIRRKGVQRTEVVACANVEHDGRGWRL